MRSISRFTLYVSVALAALTATSETQAAVVCRKKNGALVVRETCRRKETSVNLADFGAVGPQGPPGPPGPFVASLPSGKTLRGSYAAVGMGVAGGIQQFVYAPVTFAVPLATAPTPHVITLGATPPAECPGNAVSPAAAPGHVCVYEAAQVANNAPTVVDPTTSSTAGTRPWGFLISVTPAFSANAGYGSWGTWAVTAP